MRLQNNWLYLHIWPHCAMPGRHFSLKRDRRHTQLQSAIDMTDQTQILSKHHLNPSLPEWLEKFKDREKYLHAAHFS